MPKPLSVSTVLSDFLSESGLEAAIERTGVLEEWDELMGERIARVTNAVEVRGDTVVVEVSSSSWLNELTMMRPQMLEQLNSSAGRPPFGRIHFRLAEGAEGGFRARWRSRRTREDV
ncbi:MAG: DUF721 domain-containing protein [Longimicrobiales bacterium]